MTKQQFLEEYNKPGNTLAVEVYNDQGRGLMFVNDEGQIICKFHGDYLKIKAKDFKNWELKPLETEA